MTQKATLTICHVMLSKLGHESRLEKEIQFARKAYGVAVEVIGVEDNATEISENLLALANVNRISTVTAIDKIPGINKLARLAIWLRSVRSSLRRFDCDMIVAHSLPALVAVGMAGLKRGYVVYDAHELETERNGFGPVRRTLARCAERMVICKADEIWAVSELIAAHYKSTYPSKTVRLLRNLPPRADTAVKTVDIRSIFSIPTEAKIFGYLGALSPGRHINEYLDVFSGKLAGRKAEAQLVFFGDGPLRPLCQKAATDNANIHWHQPVPLAEVTAITRQFDVGLCLIEPVSLSYRLSLPNKFFQHLSSGNRILILKQSEEMMRYAAREPRITAIEIDTLEAAVLAMLDTVGPDAEIADFSWESQEDVLSTAHACLNRRL